MITLTCNEELSLESGTQLVLRFKDTGREIEHAVFLKPGALTGSVAGAMLRTLADKLAKDYPS